MKVLQINQVYKFGSTGQIVYDIQKMAEVYSIDMFVAYGYPETINNVGCEINALCLQPNSIQRKFNILRTRLFDHHGFYNEVETQKLIKWMDGIKPDIIHLHNIHCHYVNVKMLFDYIKQHNILIVWTLHDCWSFTGHCAYFDYSKCDRWKTGCHHCPSIHDYPSTWFFDKSSRNYKNKKNVFTNVENITFVSPSQWLANLQQQSFLKDKPCVVINNGIDTEIFKPTESNVREFHGIGNRRMILAVAAGLAPRKGRKYLLELPKLLNDDEVLVVVGLNKGQERLFQKDDRVICLYRTKTADELVNLYSTADVFINPTLEDNFPTTNIEALACGTPVVTFNTGGSGECVDKQTGIVVEQGDMTALLSAIRTVIYNGKEHYKDACVRKAQERYNKKIQYFKYIKLYNDILG